MTHFTKNGGIWYDSEEDEKEDELASQTFAKVMAFGVAVSVALIPITALIYGITYLALGDPVTGIMFLIVDAAAWFFILDWIYDPVLSRQHWLALTRNKKYIAAKNLQKAYLNILDYKTKHGINNQQYYWKEESYVYCEKILHGDIAEAAKFKGSYIDWIKKPYPKQLIDNLHKCQKAWIPYAKNKSSKNTQWLFAWPCVHYRNWDEDAPLNAWGRNYFAGAKFPKIFQVFDKLNNRSKSKKKRKHKS